MLYSIPFKISIFFFGLASLSILDGSCADAQSLRDEAQVRVHGLYLPGAELSEDQSSPSCPGDICPGIGNAFYLPGTNMLLSATGGNIFFKNRTLGDCVKVYDATSNNRSFKTADSMEQFVTNTMAEANLDASYKSKTLTSSATAELVTGYSSDITTTFHSTNLDITVITHSIDFQQDTRCFGEDNVEEAFLTQFESLAAIDKKNVAKSASWSPYVGFLQDQGSHVMMQQRTGSRFQQWESTSSEDSKVKDTLKAKACANVQGTSGGDWSVAGCGAYDSEELRNAQKFEAKSERLVLGGTQETRTALAQGGTVSEEALDAFIASAEEGNQPVQFIYKPVWQLLRAIYSPACAKEGKDSEACANMQRASNLEAAYQGWLAIGCPELKTSRGDVYQTMAVAGATTLGIDTYECRVAKTGCQKDGDCNLGGAGSVCYCYGPGCLEGQKIKGTDLYRDIIRGTKEGSYNQGVNNSCKFSLPWQCNCDADWSGDLAERTIYQQAERQLQAD